MLKLRAVSTTVLRLQANVFLAGEAGMRGCWWCTVQVMVCKLCISMETIYPHEVSTLHHGAAPDIVPTPQKQATGAASIHATFALIAANAHRCGTSHLVIRCG